jgi:hypothetical protein
MRGHQQQRHQLLTAKARLSTLKRQLTVLRSTMARMTAMPSTAVAMVSSLKPIQREAAR